MIETETFSFVLFFTNAIDRYQNSIKLKKKFLCNKSEKQINFCFEKSLAAVLKITYEDKRKQLKRTSNGIGNIGV